MYFSWCITLSTNLAIRFVHQLFPGIRLAHQLFLSNIWFLHLTFPSFHSLPFSQNSSKNICIIMVDVVNQPRGLNVNIVAAITSLFVAVVCMLLICFIDICISSITVFQTILSTWKTLSLSLFWNCKLSFTFCELDNHSPKFIDAFLKKIFNSV